MKKKDKKKVAKLIFKSDMSKIKLECLYEYKILKINN